MRVCRLLLLLNDGVPPIAVCGQLPITTPTVFKWRERYLETGIEGMSDLPRSGQPLRLDAEKSKKS
ncbi:Transposase [Pseudomonas amygdali pv. mori]|uniref:Transposase n=1 Tax=Pseudomonas amygdali pv. mori TaxID=34065 RepID=A0A3M4KNR3_PSEA0|nr:Transposase [Pseudomonas amygdali pv. mori]RMR46718.1 Transposase [Pseudomonas amygdali pv. mori]